MQSNFCAGSSEKGFLVLGCDRIGERPQTFLDVKRAAFASVALLLAPCGPARTERVDSQARLPIPALNNRLRLIDTARHTRDPARA
jgi:hypothetical protein